MGPGDRLTNVIINNSMAFSGSIDKGSNEVDVNLGQWGTMRLSWGADDQGPPGLINLGPYKFGGQRGKIRCVFQGLYFGVVGSTSVPTVELVIERCPDVPGFPHGDQRLIRKGSGVSPIAVIYEIMTNVRYGLGIPSGKFNIPYIQDQINKLFFNFIWISPFDSNNRFAL